MRFHTKKYTILTQKAYSNDFASNLVYYAYNTFAFAGTRDEKNNHESVGR